MPKSLFNLFSKENPVNRRIFQILSHRKVKCLMNVFNFCSSYASLGRKMKSQFASSHFRSSV